MISASNNNSDQNTIELKSLIQLLKILPNKLTETTPKSLVQEISKVKNIHGMVGKRGFVSCKTFKPLNQHVHIMRSLEFGPWTLDFECCRLALATGKWKQNNHFSLAYKYVIQVTKHHSRISLFLSKR